ncbi:hypothetical protein [Robiginitalea aurantiaca]|uniref:Transglycosylase SLT domain-containing protein n=1 Tax=Robiginitalea aurantiaca TaxID=3056915 RepID=A0ABT7WH31_9FLAO|nr:hypothetical protein [Robiginitalea aurantiaca]MDM9632124.1 hypothetical protein [Robiginitalea aurantiaca]
MKRFLFLIVLLTTLTTAAQNNYLSDEALDIKKNSPNLFSCISHNVDHIMPEINRQAISYKWIEEVADAYNYDTQAQLIIVRAIRNSAKYEKFDPVPGCEVDWYMAYELIKDELSID